MKLFGKNLKNIRRLGIAVIISLFFGAIAIIYSYNYLNEMIKRSLVEIAKQGSKSVEHHVNWSLDKLAVISRTDIIKNENFAVSEKIKFLKEIDRNSIYELAYITLDGRLYTASGREFDIRSEEFFNKAVSGEKTVAVTSSIPLYEGFSTIVFTVPVYEGDSVNGAVCSLNSPEVLCSLIEDISFSKEGYGYIIDENGITLAHKNRDYVRIRMNSTNDAINDPALKQLAEIEKRMMKGETGAGPYFFNGQRKMMGFSKIANVPWSFAAAVPVTDALINSNSMLALISFLVFFFILVILIINFYFQALNRRFKKEEQSLKKAVETANIIIISFFDDGLILEFNKNAEEKLGYSRDKVVKTLRIFDMLSSKDQIKLRKALSESLNGAGSKNFELSMKTSTGQTEHMMFSFNIYGKDTTETVYELMGICITDRVLSEIKLIEKHDELSAVYEELAASEEELKDQLDELIQQKIMLQEKDERHNLIVEASNIGIWDWDAETDTYFYSDKWYEILEVDKKEIEGREKEYRENAIVDEDKHIAEHAVSYHLEHKTPYYECEYRIHTPDGRIKWIYAVGKAMFDSNGKPVRMAGANTDVTARKEYEEKVYRLAYYDSLTGLPNRSQLSEYFNTTLKDISTDLALIIIDLDNFKLVNDSYGHETGDKLLIEVSKRLNAKTSENMYLSKIAGDDFALLVWDYGSEGLLTETVEDIINYIEGLIGVDNYIINVSVNAGIAIYHKHADSFEELLKNADVAKYKATEKRSKYEVYDKAMNDAIVERLHLGNSLKMALENKEFMLYYQPQYRTKDKKIIGFEALIRWKSESMGIVSPGRFIPVAEETGLIIPLGDWILEEAVKFIKSIHGQGYPDMIISVNISAIQLIQDDFSDKVAGVLEKYDLDSDYLELEITESVMMESMDSVINNINRLREMGVSIALDDFGTGYSSLNYLTKIPINTLKIDKSFIDNIGIMDEKDSLISSIVDIGQRLGLSIVAEGVETEEQFKYLAQKRCERIQGYFFSKPLPQDSVFDLLKEQ